MLNFTSILTPYHDYTLFNERVMICNYYLGIFKELQRYASTNIHTGTVYLYEMHAYIHAPQEPVRKQSRRIFRASQVFPGTYSSRPTCLTLALGHLSFTNANSCHRSKFAKGLPFALTHPFLRYVGMLCTPSTCCQMNITLCDQQQQA